MAVSDVPELKLFLNQTQGQQVSCVSIFHVYISDGCVVTQLDHTMIDYGNLVTSSVVKPRAYIVADTNLLTWVGGRHAINGSRRIAGARAQYHISYLSFG